jgi:hypothetical protein
MWKPQKYVDILCLIQKNNTNTERVFFPRVEKNIEIDVQDQQKPRRIVSERNHMCSTLGKKKRGVKESSSTKAITIQDCL